MKIFISYRRADSKYVVDRIRDRLIEAYGEDAVFRDIESIPLGQNFSDVLKETTTTCDVMLVAIGPQWAGITDTQGNKRLFDPHDYTRLEVEVGLTNKKIPVIPILVMNATMPNAAEIPESLKDLLFRNAISIRNDPDFTPDMQRLINGINEQVPSAAKSHSSIQKEKKVMDNNDSKVTAKNNSNAVGNISIGGSMSGNLVVGNNNQVSNTISNGLGAADIKQLFDSVYSKIDALPQLDKAVKEDAKEEIRDIQENITEAVTNKGNLDESFLTRRFRSIARMAPDILDVIVSTIANPLGGVGVAVKKIADKAKVEARG